MEACRHHLGSGIETLSPCPAFPEFGPTCAKGLTNGAVPMGGVIVSDKVYDALMGGPESAIELLHRYTYSAHHLACAAALAGLDVYQEQDLFGRAARIDHPVTAIPMLCPAKLSPEAD